MLNTRQERLLKLILNMVEEDNVYKIIDKSEMLSQFKKRHSVSEEALTELMYGLQKYDCINIKYVDENVYCFAVQKAGRLYFEKNFDEHKEIQKLRRIFFYYTILAGLTAFMGTALALLLFS